MAPEFAPGLLVFGRYRLDRELGRGGAGVVYAQAVRARGDGQEPERSVRVLDFGIAKLLADGGAGLLLALSVDGGVVEGRTGWKR